MACVFLRGLRPVKATSRKEPAFTMTIVVCKRCSKGRSERKRRSWKRIRCRSRGRSRSNNMSRSRSGTTPESSPQNVETNEPERR